MKLISKIIICILPLVMMACTNKLETEFNPPFYSLSEYETMKGTKSIGMGEEYVLILKDETLMEKKYNYSLKEFQTIILQKSVNNISDILKNKVFFDKHKKIFEPFDGSSLSRIIYHKNKALVSFGLSTSKHSFTFGDYILELKKGKILIYTLGISGACG